MQAVAFSQCPSSRASRWLLHTAILGLCVPLLFGLMTPSGLDGAGMVETLQSGGQHLSTSSNRVLEWLPVRNPIRTDPPRDPSPPRASLLTWPSAPAVVPAPRLPGPAWALTHREAGLFSGPGEDSQYFTTLPQWSYLKVLDQAPGWLLVQYEGDGNRAPGRAWVPAGAVGAVGTPRWLANLRETPLFAGPEASAQRYTSLPAWSILEALGESEGDRILVRYAGDGDARQPGQAWARVADLDVARAPVGSRLPWGIGPGSPDDAARLAVPYRTQLDGSRFGGANCGPSSVGMALESFGVLAPTADLRELANRLQGTWDPSSGVAIEVLAAIVRRYELRALELDDAEGALRRWSLDDLRRHLRAGHPVIPQLRYRLMPGRESYPVGYDHYVVLTGFSDDTFFYNDPLSSGGQGQNLAISARSLLRAWDNSDFPLAAFAVTR